MTTLMTWRDFASCLTEDPETFFPVSPKPEFAEPAKRICAACPVREQCLAWALDAGVTDGIWGGLTEGERRELRTARVAA